MDNSLTINRSDICDKSDSCDSNVSIGICDNTDSHVRSDSSAKILTFCDSTDTVMNKYHEITFIYKK